MMYCVPILETFFHLSVDISHIFWERNLVSCCFVFIHTMAHLLSETDVKVAKWIVEICFLEIFHDWLGLLQLICE